LLFGLSLFSAILAKKILKMSPNWYIGSFIPLILLKIHDIKHFPYSELENFYRYSLEVKSAKQIYKNNKENIIGELRKYDETKFYEIHSQLKKSEITLIEVINDLDNQYIEL
jgi:hypothetical protein